MRLPVALAVGIALTLSGACLSPQQKDGPPASPVSALAPGADAGASVRLSAEVLQRFMAYQAAFASASAEVAATAQRLEASHDAGLRGDPQALAEATRVVRRQAEARRNALAHSELAERDVQGIERMVSDVLGERLYGRSVDPTAMQKQLEEVVAKVPPEARAEFQQAIDQLKARSQATQALAKQRALYGDANVDLILAHEAELQKHWTAMAAGLAGGP